MPRGSQKIKQRASQAEDVRERSQASQNSGRRGRRKRNFAADDEAGGSQASQAKHALSKDEMDRKVLDFVRYMLFMDAKKTTVKRPDLVKNVLKEHSRAFASVFTEAQKKLKKTFGYELIEAEHNKQKVYILLNKLHKEAAQVNQGDPEEFPKMGLLLVILAIIFMKDNVVSEELLWQTLKRLGVNKGESHGLFGDVEKLIAVEFVKQMYLDRKKVITGDVATYEYKWGLRAEHEITKRQVLEFVSQIYDSELQAWTAKYKEVVQEEDGSGSD